VRDAYGKLRASVQGEPTAAGDMALIYNYQKMLDPGSIVRESEFATAARAGSYGDRIKAAVENVQSGRLLTNDMRADFTRKAHEQFQSALQQQQELEGQYRGIAGQTMPNYPAEVIVPDFAGTAAQWEPVVPQPAPPSPTIVEQGRGLLGDAFEAVGREARELFGGGGAPDVANMTPDQADAFVQGLTDEQLRALPPATVQALERLLAEGGTR
jgi:hypothetical protein